MAVAVGGVWLGHTGHLPLALIMEMSGIQWWMHHQSPFLHFQSHLNGRGIAGFWCGLFLEFFGIWVPEYGKPIIEIHLIDVIASYLKYWGSYGGILVLGGGFGQYPAHQVQIANLRYESESEVRIEIAQGLSELWARSGPLDLGGGMWAVNDNEACFTFLVAQKMSEWGAESDLNRKKAIAKEGEGIS
ncbi:hypothetical protein DL93DRAFT_2103718 [Clavulina sp. PMI_390]|nr:hypothetical protein DL93DRAFT_2103718 [Clavulina sp. PMI_390]